MLRRCSAATAALASSPLLSMSGSVLVVPPRPASACLGRTTPAWRGSVLQRRACSGGSRPDATTTTTSAQEKTPPADEKTEAAAAEPADPAEPAAAAPEDAASSAETTETADATVEASGAADAEEGPVRGVPQLRREGPAPVAREALTGSVLWQQETLEKALMDARSLGKYPSRDELYEKYGVLATMDGRHEHLTPQEFARLWWKLQDFTKLGTTLDAGDINTTAMQKENWELTYKLLVCRLPPSLQALYEETFNTKYLSFRPPKMRVLGMPPPQDYLEVWQAEQPTFYMNESLANHWTYRYRAGFWGRLRALGVPVAMPAGGYARLQLSHPITNDQPNLVEAYKHKLQAGQVVKLKPPSGVYPAPPKVTRFFPFPRRRAVGSSPNYLACPWAEVVALRASEEEDAEGKRGREIQVKVFKNNSQEHGLGDDESWVDSQNYTLEWVAEDRVVLGASSVDYIPVGASLADPESRDLIRFLWPAALVKRESVKYLYSQDGHEYLWQSNLAPTHANSFTVNALMIPFEFVSKREPDLPNTLGKIAIVVGDREYPIMVDFWDALKRFEEAYKNLPLNTLRIFGIFWVIAHILKYTLITRTLKPYNYGELQRHPRYKHVYGTQNIKSDDGRGPWAYDKDQ